MGWGGMGVNWLSSVVVVMYIDERLISGNFWVSGKVCYLCNLCGCRERVRLG